MRGGGMRNGRSAAFVRPDAEFRAGPCEFVSETYCDTDFYVMAQSSPKSRVKSGIPWWLWLLMLIVGGGVLIAVAVRAVPEDPEQFYEEALAGFDNNDHKTLLRGIEKLEGRPEYAAHYDLLKGLDLIAVSRPLKAIPLLESAAKEPKVRARALTALGRALFRGSRHVEATDVLRKAIAEDKAALTNYGVLSNQLYELGAFDEALKVAEVLTKEGGKTAAGAHAVRGAMLKDLERYAEAAVEFEAALEADPVNPGNGEIATKLVTCLVASGNPARAKEFLDAADASAEKEIARIECMLNDGQVEEAVKVLEPALQGGEGGPGAPVDPRIQLVYGKVMMQRGKSRAEEVLVRLQTLALGLPRDEQLYRVAADVARVAEQNEEADLYEQNYDALQKIRKEYVAVRDSVITNCTDGPGRLKCGDLAAEIGKYEVARFWYNTAERVDPKLAPEASARISALYVLRPELVSLGRFKAVPPSRPGSEEAGMPREEIPLFQPDAAPSSTPETQPEAAPPSPVDPDAAAKAQPDEPKTEAPKSDEPTAQDESKPAVDEVPGGASR